MKQTITVDQLNELSDKGKEKLREWWNPEVGDWWYERIEEYHYEQNFDEGGLADPTDVKNALPLLSIGQMIEFLDNSNFCYLHIDRNDDRSPNPPIWDVKEGFNPPTPKGKRYVYEELVDALWEAVKEVLEAE